MAGRVRLGPAHVFIFYQERFNFLFFSNGKAIESAYSEVHVISGDIAEQAHRTKTSWFCLKEYGDRPTVKYSRLNAQMCQVHHSLKYNSPLRSRYCIANNTVDAAFASLSIPPPLPQEFIAHGTGLAVARQFSLHLGYGPYTSASTSPCKGNQTNL